MLISRCHHPDQSSSLYYLFTVISNSSFAEVAGSHFLKTPSSSSVYCHFSESIVCLDLICCGDRNNVEFLASELALKYAFVFDKSSPSYAFESCI